MALNWSRTEIQVQPPLQLGQPVYWTPHLPPNTLHPSGVNYANFSSNASHQPSVASYSTGSQRGLHQVADSQMPPRSVSEPIGSNLDQPESQPGGQPAHSSSCRCSLYLGQVLGHLKEQEATAPEFQLSWDSASDKTIFDFKVKTFEGS